eukprot:Nk52_evm33s78 gene=Nk52_evmTU33s78
MHAIGLVSVPAVSLIWSGVCIGICVEARAKFNAPTLTKAIGFDVGRHVFSAIRKLEIALCGTVWGIYFQHVRVGGYQYVNSSTGFSSLSLATCLALAQWLWLAPILNERAAAFIAGKPPGDSKAHLAYVLVEGAKIVSLLYSACSFLSF